LASVSAWTIVGQILTLVIFALFIVAVVWIPLTLYRMNKRQAEMLELARRQQADSGASSRPDPDRQDRPA
jgi:F0F1-type ATP synthase membrane subunit b/b'